MDPLKVLFVSAEVAPFSKTGGLGDVSGALPRYLHEAGHDVRLFTPLYSKIDPKGRDFQPEPALRGIPVRLGSRTYRFNVYTAPLPQPSSTATTAALRVNFIDCPALYHRPGIYTQDRDEHLRYSHRNEEVELLYQDFLGAPLGEKSHHLLHTHYVRREAVI